MPGASLGALTAVGGLVEAPLADTNTPYTLQYNVTVQRELPGAVLLEVAYVGNRGRQLSRGGEGGYTLNQVDPKYLSLGSGLNDLVDNPFYKAAASGVLVAQKVSRAQLLRPYPQFDAIHPLFFQGATSDYNSLQVSFSHRFSKGLVFDGNYTWAKAIDEGTSYQELRLQFRAEAFNAFSRVRFSSPNTDVNAGANFGRVTSQSNDPRQLQFGLKLLW